MILLVIDTRERYAYYAECLSTKQAARLHEDKGWVQQITLQQPDAKCK